MKTKKVSILLILFVSLTLLAYFSPAGKASTIIVMRTFNALPEDGYLRQWNTNYLAVWNASTGQIISTGDYIGQGQFNLTGLYYIYRSFLFFDTTSIPLSANIISTKLGVYIENDDSQIDFNVVIQNGQPTYPHSPLQQGDYWQGHYSGDGGSRNTSSISGLGYWNITFNYIGLGYIQKGSETKLAVRSSRDINHIAPSINGEDITFYAYEHGVDYAAKLYVTYACQPIQYIIHGPYYEDGTVAHEVIKVIVTQPYNSSIIFYLNGMDGVAKTVNLALGNPASYMYWNISTVSNDTRIYYFLPTQTFDEVWIYVPDLAKPFYPYSFTITDFYGMINPYLETTINIGGQTRIVERKSLSTVGTVSFMMQQWNRYGLRFRCDQGLYTQYFDAENTFTTNLQVLSGAFPISTQGTNYYAYAQRFNGTTIQITYSDPTSSTIWLYYQITHKSGGSTIMDAHDNLTATNSFAYSWIYAQNQTDYNVNIESYITTLHSWAFTCPAPSILINPWTNLFESLGSYPTGFSPALIPASIIILFVLGIFSYASVGLGCVLAWITTGVMMLLGWFTIGLPTFAFAGFVSFLIVIQESKKTEREL